MSAGHFQAFLKPRPALDECEDWDVIGTGRCGVGVKHAGARIGFGVVWGRADPLSAPIGSRSRGEILRVVYLNSLTPNVRAKCITKLQDR
jgi:hypothetical protein